VRLDFFVDGGVGGGAAVLIGDSLRTPPEADGGRYLPPVPLLWAALGVVRISGADTVARILTDTLWIELRDVSVWRAAWAGRGLAVVERIDGGRKREAVRRDSLTVTYRSFASRRRLTLTALRRIPERPFDSNIWRF
jgi:hypothetical protein